MRKQTKKKYSGKGKSWEKRESRDDKRDFDRSEQKYVNKYGVFNVPEENDPAWWCKDTVLVRNAANLAYSWATGVYNYPETRFELPVVCNLGTLHGPGVSLDNATPINNAARRIYGEIRKAQSGAKNYAPQDLIQYFCAMDEGYAFLAFMTKVYGLMPVYSSINRGLPRAIFTAMGVDFNDIQENLADFRSYINLFTYKINAFKVPQKISLFERHLQMYSNIYFDANDPRATVYNFRPVGFRVYDEANGKLVFNDLIGTGGNDVTFADIKALGESIINAITASESFSIMSGDIEKAYGSNVIQVSRMAEDYTVAPVYSEEVLTQIHNAIVVGYIDSTDGTCDITQDPANDALIYDPMFYLQGPTLAAAEYTTGLASKILDIASHYYVDLPKGDISPELNMVATRLLPTIKEVTTDGVTTAFKVKLGSSGTEVITGCTFVIPDRSGNGDYQTVSGSYTFAPIKNQVSPLGTFIGRAMKWSMCDWAPKLAFVIASTTAPSVSSNEGYFGDITRFAEIKGAMLENMHQVALLSIFSAPSLS